MFPLSLSLFLLFPNALGFLGVPSKKILDTLPPISKFSIRSIPSPTTRILSMKVDSKSRSSLAPTPIDPDAYILPPGLDLPYIKALSIGQLILIGFVLLLKLITGDALIPPTGSFSINFESIRMACSLSVPLIFAGFALDNLPLEFAREINRSTKFACVRMLGRTSTSVVAAATALILSISTGYLQNKCNCVNL